MPFLPPALLACPPPPTLALPPAQRLCTPLGYSTRVLPSVSALTPALASPLTDPIPPPGGWALNMKDLKLLQTIGKGEFGGEQEGAAALGGPWACGESGEQP